MSGITYYHILGISSDATDDEVAAAFRRKVKQWHPDICRHPDAEERMREINKAAGVLCDPERRARYDRALGKKDIPDIREPGSAPSGHNVPRGQGWSFRGFFRAAGSFPFRIRKGALVYAATGCAALLIFVMLVAAAWTALPLLSTPLHPVLSTPSDSNPAFPVILPDKEDRLQEEGDVRFAAGDYEGALAAYNAIIAQNPAAAERDIWYNRGTAQNALGMYNEALESFDRILQASPEDSFALAQKGAALIGLGRYEESLQYTDRALNQGSDTGWIWNNRGIALSGLGQQKEARVAFENANIFSGQPGSSALYQNVVVKPLSLSGF